MKKIQLALMISTALTLGACGSDSSNKSIFPENTGTTTGTATGSNSTPTQTTDDHSTTTTGNTTSAGTKPTTGITTTKVAGQKPTADNKKPSPPPAVAIKPNLKPSSEYSRDQSQSPKVYGTTAKNKGVVERQTAFGTHDVYESAVRRKSLTNHYDKTVFNIDVKEGENSTSYHKGLSYSDFGVTIHQAKNLPANTTYSRNDQVNAYAMGKLTQTQDIPKNGVAHYQGDAVIALPRTQKVLMANFNADVDFGQKTFNGKIHQFQVANNGVLTAIHDFNDIHLIGKVVDESNNIEENGFSGNGFIGQFYGDNAQEIGGVITGNDNNYGPYEGAFGGIAN